MKQEMKWVGLGIVMMLAVIGKVDAAATQGTSAFTQIVSSANSLEIVYKDGNDNLQPTVNASENVTTSVSAIYGIELDPLVSQTQIQTVIAGQAYQYQLTYKNVANTSDTINFNKSSGEYTGEYGNTWEVSDLSGVSVLVPEFSNVMVSFWVTPSITAHHGSELRITVNAQTSSSPFGAYTGFNDLSYGGPADNYYVTVTRVEGPELIVVTKNIKTILAPTAGYTGAGNDLVPGSKIRYELVIKNIGTTGNLLSIEQKIPDQTEYVIGSMKILHNEGSMSSTRNMYISSSYQVETQNSEQNQINLASKIRFELQKLGSGKSATLNFAVVVK